MRRHWLTEKLISFLLPNRIWLLDWSWQHREGSCLFLQSCQGNHRCLSWWNKMRPDWVLYIMQLWTIVLRYVFLCMCVWSCYCWLWACINVCGLVIVGSELVWMCVVLLLLVVNLYECVWSCYCWLWACMNVCGLVIVVCELVRMCVVLAFCAEIRNYIMPPLVLLCVCSC